MSISKAIDDALNAMFGGKATPKGPGFPCDVCGGKHPKTYSCKTCNKWVCEKHVVIETKTRPYELPEKYAYCKSCFEGKADR